MPTVELSIPPLADKFKDYRQDILGDSYNWGPAIVASNIRYFAFHHSVTPQLMKLKRLSLKISTEDHNSNEFGDEHYSPLPEKLTVAPVITEPTLEQRKLHGQTAIIDGKWKDECDRIAQEHVNGNGWGGVGYRFIICSNGVVAYVGDLSHGGSAVANHNDALFSACMIGDFTKILPTDAQIMSAHILQKFMLESMPAYPNLKSPEQIIGHKDASVIWNEPAFATACPGSSWPNDMRYRILNGVPYTPLPTPTPIPTPTPPPPSTDWHQKYLEQIDLNEQLKVAQRKEVDSIRRNLLDKVNVASGVINAELNKLKNI